MPLFVKVRVGKAMLVVGLLKWSVKLRNAVSADTFVGGVAAALIFVKLKSCTLSSVVLAAKVRLPLMLLA